MYKYGNIIYIYKHQPGLLTTNIPHTLLRCELQSGAIMSVVHLTFRYSDRGKWQGNLDRAGRKNNNAACSRTTLPVQPHPIFRASLFARSRSMYFAFQTLTMSKAPSSTSHRFIPQGYFYSCDQLRLSVPNISAFTPFLSLC